MFDTTILLVGADRPIANTVRKVVGSIKRCQLQQVSKYETVPARPQGPNVGLILAYLRKSDGEITRMVDELGRVGKKAGGGFYDYGGDRRQIWPGLAELVGDVVPEETGVTYLTKRLMLVQCAEVVRCVDEGILRTHRDAEVGAIFGLGFAPQTGGPLAYMDRYGLQQVVADMEALAESCGRRYFPAPGFVARADRGERFFPEPGAPQQ